MNTLTCRMKSFIQPFERELALQELRALAGGSVAPLDGDEASASLFSVSMSSEVERLRGALAYWSSVGEGPEGVTAQVRGEATLVSARSAVGATELLDMTEFPVPKLPKRRCLRYGTHGMHEYRGKFFPQLVRALINIAQLPSDATVLDPMCGSGTTLVEARLTGRRAVGLDMNPLSVFITEVKCGALELPPRVLASANEAVRTRLTERGFRLRTGGRITELSDQDREYLSRWFAPRTLRELDCVEASIRDLRGEAVRGFFRVCLSNIVRGVSWQKNADLRVRREESQLLPGETISRFLDEAERSTRTVGAFLAERPSRRLGDYMVREADARRAVTVLQAMEEGVDVVITSPPYATALPYIDTDRLSLVYLGLLERKSHRQRDKLMIGNREVTRRGREENWRLYQEKRGLLPRRTCELVDRIDRLNRSADVGFRRRNLASLLATYFLDMREVMRQTMMLLRPGGKMFLVVGDNRTTAGGQRVEIDTATHLAEIGRDVGYGIGDEIVMDMLTSRDIFRKNSMRTERILRFERG